jgi:hypothetical protein
LANNLGDDGEKREEVKANVIEKNKQKRKWGECIRTRKLNINSDIISHAYETIRCKNTALAFRTSKYNYSSD